MNHVPRFCTSEKKLSVNAYRKERLVEVARSLKDVRTGRCLHFSFILKNNKTLFFAANDYNRRHPEKLFGPYKALKEGAEYIAGTHSEISCLKGYLKKFGNLDMSGLTLFNVRLGRKGEVMAAAPCKNCSRVIEPLGFKIVEFT